MWNSLHFKVTDMELGALNGTFIEYGQNLPFRGKVSLPLCMRVDINTLLHMQAK